MAFVRIQKYSNHPQNRAISKIADDWQERLYEYERFSDEELNSMNQSLFEFLGIEFGSEDEGYDFCNLDAEKLADSLQGIIA